MSNSSAARADETRSASGSSRSQSGSRRRGLKGLLMALLSGLGWPARALGSPEPWTVDRWAGRPRRIARPRPDQPLPKRGRSSDRHSGENGQSGPPAQPSRDPRHGTLLPPTPSNQRARAGLVEQVHADPLPELPAVEHFEGRPPDVSGQPEKQSFRPRMSRRGRGSGGQGMVELLVAAPVVLFAGLVIVQVVLLMQARQALRLGVLEAARAASVAHADPQAAIQGLARGLAPWWAGAQQTQDALIAPVRTQIHLTQALASGRLRITQLAPTEAAFIDWAVPATNEEGQLLSGQREIPNDALRIRSTETQPQTALTGLRNGQPIGARSGQTLLQANVLKLQVDYVVPMRVPLAGQAIALLARTWQSDPGLRLMSSAQGVPVRVSVAARMQTPARHAGAVSG